jgi:tRNA (Thr-GGU) A37 N-methylase
VIVVGWLDRYTPEFLARRTAYPSGDERLPLQGVLALRGARPNPVSVTVCALRRVEGDSIVVRGLDLVDGTPVIDVKPYIAFYDAVPKATIPKWAGG